MRSRGNSTWSWCASSGCRGIPNTRWAPWTSRAGPTSRTTTRDTGATPAYLEREIGEQLATMRARRALYTPHRPPLHAAGRIVIVVDDGLATGATMVAALHSVRSHDPARLVCAVPVAAPGSLELVRPGADEVVCLDTPADFYAVGQFYREFEQVSDEEVVACLAAPHPA